MRHVTTAYLDTMQDLCDTNAKGPTAHKEHGASRMDRDERNILQYSSKIVQSRLASSSDNTCKNLERRASGILRKVNTVQPSKI